MNKTLLTIATLGLLILFTSAYYSAPADSRIGYKAPSLALGNSNNGLSPLQQHRGSNVLLTFWSSADPQSRLDNMHYDRLSRDERARYTHVSVNMDRSEKVFTSVIALDSLDRSAHFFSSLETQEDVVKSWRLEDGYHSFLLDGQGMIIAVDPDEKTLSQLR